MLAQRTPMVSLDSVTRLDYKKHLDTAALITLRLANMAVGGWLVYYTFFTIFNGGGISYSLTFEFFRRVFFLVVGLIIVVSDLQPVHFVRDEFSFLS